MGEARKGLSEEVTSELRSEGGERAGPKKGLATASAKALRQERKQQVLRGERGQSGWRQEIKVGGGFCCKGKGSHSLCEQRVTKPIRFTKLFARISTGSFPGLRKEANSPPPTRASSGLRRWSPRHKGAGRGPRPP